ncbi:MAG: RNA polymerase sigma factor [Eubacteriales bacterium]
MPNDDIIEEYAKKIYGFAYSKTSNPYDADDLSQEILFELCKSDFSGRNIASTDAYIYSVCRYTYAKMIRQRKRDGLFCEYVGEEALPDIAEESDSGISEEIFDKLRREIMYLGKTRREAMILYWYEGKSGEEISSLLGITPSCVRWHLHKAKNELKERMKMEVSENAKIYQPIRLSVGIHGMEDNSIVKNLATDILMQNIAYVCAGKALTVSEISRTLGVAAVYLEDKLDGLCSMEYMKKSAQGKYSTNFFIRTAEYQINEAKYRLENTPSIADAYYNVVSSAMGEIKGAGFAGEVSDDVLLWDMLLYFMMREVAKSDSCMIRQLKLEHGAPMRPDGTKHWVRAALPMDTVLPLINDGNLRDFYQNSSVSNIQRLCITPINVELYQLNAPLIGEYRTVGTEDISALKRVRELILSGDEPTDYEKSVIAGLIEKGYAARENGVLSLRIPYFSENRIKKVNEILDYYAEKLLDRSRIEEIFAGYASYIENFIPPYVSENERNHYKTSFSPYTAVLYTLVKSSRLKLPDEAEKKYVCTVMYDF